MNAASNRIRVAILLALLSGTALGAPTQMRDEQAFSVADLDGKAIDLKQLLASHKAVLINFWATWCQLCKEEVPQLAKLHDARAADGLEILGVDVAESATKVKHFAEQYGINYPLILDSDSTLAERYNVVGLPISVLITADGTLRGPYSGYTAELSGDVEQALAQ